MISMGVERPRARVRAQAVRAPRHSGQGRSPQTLPYGCFRGDLRPTTKLDADLFYHRAGTTAHSGPCLHAALGHAGHPRRVQGRPEGAPRAQLVPHGCA